MLRFHIKMNIMIKKYIVPSEYNGAKLREFLRNQGYSQTMMSRLKREGGLSVNNDPHRNIDPVHTGDIILIDFPDKDPVLTPNGALHIPIAYEDDDVVIFHKPAGILVHPATRELDDALGNYFAYLYPTVPFRPLGRLDRNTSGLCVIAKNKLTSVQLAKGIQKEYIAITQGIFEATEGTVSEPILRVSGSTIMRTVDPAGQPSVTHYRITEQFCDHALTVLRLETGRTHQIRVHMAHIGHPLAGDELYGGSTERINRHGLHCHKVWFSLNGREIEAQSPLPQDMESLIQTLRKEKK